MARTNRRRRSYSAGEWGRNRVRVFPDPRTGIMQVEWREDGRKLRRSLRHRDWAVGQEAGRRDRGRARRAAGHQRGGSRARATYPGDAF